MFTIPKLTVTNYPEMLRKLSVSFFLVTLICIFEIRANVELVDKALSKFDLVHGPVETYISFKVPFGSLAIALVFAVFSESIKLHDKISDLFKIRSNFDIKNILLPMASNCNVTLSTKQVQSLREDRQRIMGSVFYQYASSSAGRAIIDEHTIIQALTSWSWYWMLLEAIVVVFLTGLIFLSFKEYLEMSFCLGICLVFLLLSKIYISECRRYAFAEVQMILSDSARMNAVAAVFHAL